jgi:hypothetical protein
MEILKSIFKDVKYYLLTIIICFIVFYNCDRFKKINDPITHDSTAQIKDTIKILQTKVIKIDSVRTKLVFKWRTVKDTINLRDTVEVLKLLIVCDTIIYTDSVTIQTLKKINSLYANICRNDSVKIDSLTKSKKKYFRGFKHGFVTGVIVTQGLNVGVKALTLKN